MHKSKHVQENLQSNSFLFLYSEADVFRQEPSTQAHVDAYLQAWEPLLAQKDY